VTAVWLGRFVRIAFAVKNAGTVAANGVTATVTVPSEVGFDAGFAFPGAGEKWSCVKTTEHVVTCTLAALAPGEVAPLVVYAHGHEWEDLSAVSAVVVKVADGAGAAAITESAPLNHHL